MSLVGQVFALQPDQAPLADAVSDAVLQQVVAALAALAATPTQVQVIDLRSLPLDAAGVARLRQRLGAGEVIAEVRSAALTWLEETAFAGVWWQTQHRGASDAADPWQAIVVAQVPPLLAAHPDDVAEAAARLAAVAHPSDSGGKA
ncbi:hypothetical protein KAK06_11765 [Ideonella sp. 4Y11]|uniref:HupH hydrogenase expression protein C-terminal domain-containing protein n=1 Tax=Ideonella aquatica TaxID=2824119 RepID=A0A941BK77_9BURK|nr:hydrogenase expression/formation C-terminal domain-containing protein [Ideonella aquatica]MBQ0959623.1 hypothetical protein [Ideonella aquatica]